MERDFVPAPMKIGDLIGAYDTPEVAALTKKARCDVESPARAVGFEYRGTRGKCADRHVIKREGDQGFAVSHQSRRERQMARGSMRCAPR